MLFILQIQVMHAAAGGVSAFSRHRAEAHPDQLAIAGEKMLLPFPTALQQPRVALFLDICSTVVAHN